MFQTLFLSLSSQCNGRFVLNVIKTSYLFYRVVFFSFQIYAVVFIDRKIIFHFKGTFPCIPTPTLVIPR